MTACVFLGHVLPHSPSLQLPGCEGLHSHFRALGPVKKAHEGETSPPGIAMPERMRRDTAEGEGEGLVTDAGRRGLAPSLGYVSIAPQSTELIWYLAANAIKGASSLFAIPISLGTRVTCLSIPSRS